MNHQACTDDTRSQTTEITLLKEKSATQNGSSSSIDNPTEADIRSLKKAKRKSDLILSNKEQLLETQHQKSLSLSNQRSKRAKKSPLSVFKRDLSAPNTQMKADSVDSSSKLAAKSIKKDLLSPGRASQQNQVQANQPTNKPIGQLNNSSPYAVDAVNSVDPNHSYILLYKNCSNMHNSLKDSQNSESSGQRW